MDLALINLQRLICHKTKPSQKVPLNNAGNYISYQNRNYVFVCS